MWGLDGASLAFFLWCAIDMGNRSASRWGLRKEGDVVVRDAHPGGLTKTGNMLKIYAVKI